MSTEPTAGAAAANQHLVRVEAEAPAPSATYTTARAGIEASPVVDNEMLVLLTNTYDGLG